MTRDAFDALLDSSAPALNADSRLDASDVRRMSRDARVVAQPRTGRRRATWVALGSVVAIGGLAGGVAVASTMMPQGFDDPWAEADYTRGVTLPSGRDCEIRIMVVDDAGNRELSGSSLELSQWFAMNDVWALMDLDAAREQDQAEANLHPDQTLLLDENGRLGDAQVSAMDRTPDDVYANVVSLAMAAAVDSAAREVGAQPGDVFVWDSIRCDAVVG